jgi:hypothetical protein
VKLVLALSACGLLAASAPVPADAAVIHHWRFEDVPGFLEDSVGGASLAGTPLQTALPGAGPGAAFAARVPDNAASADFAGAEALATVLPDAPTGSFTIELFVHFEALTGSFGEHLAGPALGAQNQNIGWTLQYRFATGTLQLIPCLAAACELVDSGIPLAAGKDYYVAAAFDVADESGGEVTFYVLNLTDGGALQIVTVPHSTPSYNPIDTLAIGATADNGLGVEGLIDEVRLSDMALELQDLLIVPEPGYALLLVTGTLVLVGARQLRGSARG